MKKHVFLHIFSHLYIMSGYNHVTFSGVVFPSNNRYEIMSPFSFFTLYAMHLFQTRFGMEVRTQNHV
jgi:hypothetical protein